MEYKLRPLLFCLCLLTPVALLANNVSIDAARLVDYDSTNNTYDIKFDISWDNSWRCTDAPAANANWDAAWIFVKFSSMTAGAYGDWKHCTLKNTGNVVPTGASMSFGDTGGVYKGLFMYRSAGGQGSVNWDNAEVRWDYGTDGVSDGATVRIKVFAMEMVYVSSGPFYAGDGTNRTGGTNSHFFDAADNTDPRNAVYITSTPPYISNVSDGSGTAGDITWVNESGNAGSLPGSRTQLSSSFPTGTTAFYIMKYEISQRQYCEFLNCLNSSQQVNRYDAALNFNSYRNFIKRSGASAPYYFGCDANNNAGSATAATKTSLNETDDGEWVACNYVSWPDLCAYADWASLRPFTELEYEKACRGPSTAVQQEYAWGNTTMESILTSITNSATKSEVPNQGNCNYYVSTYWGPLRCGSYADATSTRQNAGAGYYGALDLSGSLYERTVTIGDDTGKAFTGTHGDGNLSSGGYGTNSDWPGYVSGKIDGATGSGYRGGDWGDDTTYARLSDRYLAASAAALRNFTLGVRLARTSQ